LLVCEKLVDDGFFRAELFEKGNTILIPFIRLSASQSLKWLSPESPAFTLFVVVDVMASCWSQVTLHETIDTPMKKAEESKNLRACFPFLRTAFQCQK
jgi:hypothetical protein